MSARRFDNLVFHPDDGRLEHERTARSEHLRPKTARLLECLLDHAGEVVPRETLIESIWGSESVVDFDSGLAALLRELRQALVSVGDNAELVETVPRRGYRINTAPSGDRMPRRRPVLWILFLAALAIVGLVVGLGVRWALLNEDGQPGAESAPFSLAILPFEVYDAGERMPEHLDLLLADTVLAELLSRPVQGLDLIGRTSLRPYLGREDVAAAAASDLGVDLLIEGSVLAPGGGEWRVEMRLLAVPPGRVVWSTTTAGKEGNTLEVLPIARALASELVADWPRLRSQIGRRENSSTN